MGQDIRLYERQGCRGGFPHDLEKNQLTAPLFIRADLLDVQPARVRENSDALGTDDFHLWLVAGQSG